MEDKTYCEACEELKFDHPELIANGFNAEHEANFAEDNGLSAKDENDDCYDLNLMNDCLIGSLEDEAEIAGMCGWQDMIKKMTSNLWTMFKAITSAICGIWENIWNIWSEIRLIWKSIQKLNCIVEFIGESGHSFKLSEDETENSYVVAGEGVSFRLRGSGGVDSGTDITLRYIGGALCKGTGSLSFFTEDFYDYDADGNVVRRIGNTIWGIAGKTVSGNELVYEIRIKPDEYGIKDFSAGFGQETAGGAYSIVIHPFYAGEYAYGQHGGCNRSTGDPSQPGNSRGHLVPDGWMYIQVRMSWIDELVTYTSKVTDADGNRVAGRNVTPWYWSGMTFEQDSIECD